jgi:ABC-type multidrug transport system ATPase subunit
MRLPRAWSRARIKQEVNEVISFLDLGDVMDNIVGTEEERGISGGQRKRTNIGMELVANPIVLLLDEPTSGLDSSMAREICATLRNIAHERQLLVAAVIHSPSPSTFRLFDDVLLLGKGGRVVYFGEAAVLDEYMRSIGFECPVDERYILSNAINVLIIAPNIMPPFISCETQYHRFCNGRDCRESGVGPGRRFWTRGLV